MRGLATIFTMIAFLSVSAWAYSKSRKSRFEEAGQVPFAENAAEFEELTKDRGQKQ